MDINNIRDIVIVVLFVVVLYLVYKTRKLEGFPTVPPSDTDAIQNLAAIARQIMTPSATGGVSDKLNIPAKTTQVVSLNVTGDVTLDPKYDLFQRYMVIPWAGPLNSDNTVTIPPNWALCDGRTYGYNTVTKTFVDITTSTTDQVTYKTSMIKTPDLRQRFILGTGNSTSTNTSKIFGEDTNYNTTTTIGTTTTTTGTEITQYLTGGEATHKLSKTEMPKHNHLLSLGYRQDSLGGGSLAPVYGNKVKRSGERTAEQPGLGQNPHVPKNEGANATDYAHDSNFQGADEKHNNMPPFYALTYIMKL